MLIQLKQRYLFRIGSGIFRQSLSGFRKYGFKISCIIVKITETRCVITDIYILSGACIVLVVIFVIFTVFIVFLIVFVIFFVNAIVCTPDCILKLIPKTIILQFQKILYGIGSCLLYTSPSPRDS